MEGVLLPGLRLDQGTINTHTLTPTSPMRAWGFRGGGLTHLSAMDNKDRGDVCWKNQESLFHPVPLSYCHLMVLTCYISKTVRHWDCCVSPCSRCWDISLCVFIDVTIWHVCLCLLTCICNLPEYLQYWPTSVSSCMNLALVLQHSFLIAAKKNETTKKAHFAATLVSFMFLNYTVVSSFRHMKARNIKTKQNWSK